MATITNHLRGHFPGLAALLLVISCLFAATVIIRLPWMECLSPEEPFDFVTAVSVRTVNEWFREGALESRLGIYPFPKVTDPNLKPFPDYEEVFPGYPPGLFLPLYVYAVITGRPCHTALVTAYGMLCHFLTALFLAGTLYLCTIRVNGSRWTAVLLALIPAILALFAPCAIYYFQKTYWSDIQVLALYPALVMLEVAWDIARSRDSRSAQRVIAGLQAATVFFGVLTEWLFGPLLIVLLAKRFLLDRQGKSLRGFVRMTLPLVVPAAIAMVLFFVWIVLLFGITAIGSLAGKFLIHSGISWDVDRFHRVFWGTYIPEAFGQAGAWAILGSIAVCVAVTVAYLLRRLASGRRHRLAEHLMLYSWLLWAPCVMHSLILREHSLANVFSTAKYVIPLAALPFGLLPLTIAAFLQPASDSPVQTSRRLVWQLVPALMLIAGASVVAAVEFPRYRQFYKPCADYEEISSVIREHSTEDDAVFGWFRCFPSYPADADLIKYTSYSDRIIIPITEMNQMLEVLERVDRELDVVLVALELDGFADAVQPIADRAFEKVQYAGFQLMKFRRQDLLQALQSVAPAVD